MQLSYASVMTFCFSYPIYINRNASRHDRDISNAASQYFYFLFYSAHILVGVYICIWVFVLANTWIYLTHAQCKMHSCRQDAAPRCGESSRPHAGPAIMANPINIYADVRVCACLFAFYRLFNCAHCMNIQSKC